MRKEIWNRLTNNLATVIGIIGIILTLFFGVFYVPNRIREASIERLHGAQYDVEQSVKELAFSDASVNYMEVKFLIDAKEIQLREKFPFSMLQVLTLAQQSFMQDKFLPLATRKELVGKLEEVKASVPKALEETFKKDKGRFWSWSTLGSILSIIISIGAAAFGAVSLVERYKKEMEIQEEINNEIEQTEMAVTMQKHYASEMEQRLLAILKNKEGLSILNHSTNGNAATDVHFIYKNKEYVAAFRLLRSKISLSTIRQVIYSASDLQGEIWFIHTTGLTTMAMHEVKNANQKYPDIIFKEIRVNNEEEFEQVIKKQLH